MSPITGDGKATYTFSTSHHAMWAEDLALEKGITAELGSPPSGAEDACGLALRIDSTRATELEATLRKEGIDFARWSPG